MMYEIEQLQQTATGSPRACSCAWGLLGMRQALITCWKRADKHPQMAQPEKSDPHQRLCHFAAGDRRLGIYILNKQRYGEIFCIITMNKQNFFFILIFYFGNSVSNIAAKATATSFLPAKSPNDTFKRRVRHHCCPTVRFSRQQPLFSSPAINVWQQPQQSKVHPRRQSRRPERIP